MALRPFLLCALACLGFGCQLTPDQQLVGAWTADRRMCQIPNLSSFDDEHRFVNGIYATQLKLSADHTFILTGLRQFGGKWTYEDGVLKLQPASDSHTSQWPISKSMRKIEVTPDFGHMKVTIPLPMFGKLIIVLDKTA